MLLAKALLLVIIALVGAVALGAYSYRNPQRQPVSVQWIKTSGTTVSSHNSGSGSTSSSSSNNHSNNNQQNTSSSSSNNSNGLSGDSSHSGNTSTSGDNHNHSKPSETWAKKYITSGQDYPGINGVVEKIVRSNDKDGGYVAAGVGYENSSAWVFKMDSNGKILWQSGFPYYGRPIASLENTADGGYVIAGNVFNTTDSGWMTGLIVKLDGKGNIAWAETLYPGPGHGELSLVKPTQDNGLLVMGYPAVVGFDSDSWIVKLDDNRHVQWEKTYKTVIGSAIALDDGGFLIAGSDSTTDNASNAVVMRLDNSGNVEWSKSYGPGAFGNLHANTDGSFLASGGVLSSALVTKITGKGDLVWEYSYSSGNNVTSAGQIFDSPEGYVIAGSQLKPSEHDARAGWTLSTALIKISSDGRKVEWSKLANIESGWVASTDDNGFIVAGDRAYGYTMGPYTGPAWVFKLDKNGTCCGTSTMFHSDYVATSTGIKQAKDLSIPTGQFHASVTNTSLVPVTLSISVLDIC